MSIRPIAAAPNGAGGESHEATILLVESSASVGLELAEQLRADCYPVALARSAEHARSLARGHTIRAIVLGALDSPRGALDLLEEVRRGADRLAPRSEWNECVPTLLLSSTRGQLDLLRAFEAGADDFVVQEGHYYLELRARLRALLRRAECNLGARLCIGPLEIDTRAHRVRVGGVAVELCRLEYELLVHLARDPTVVRTKQELLRSIWDQRSGVAGRTVDSHASRLRRKLGSAGAPGLVVNVWGVGYRLV